MMTIMGKWIRRATISLAIGLGLAVSGGPLHAAPMTLSALIDVPYGDGPRQTMDVYFPQGDPVGPVLVMLHGGGWAGGDKAEPSVWRAKARHWTAKGYVFVSVSTRLLPDAAPREQAVDLARAVAFVQHTAPEWGADPARIVMMGHSAGAHVSALAATDPEIRAEAGVRPVRGLVSLDTAALDVAGLMTSEPATLYHNAFGPAPEAWDRSSPTARLTPEAPPALLVCSLGWHGACAGAKVFAARAKGLGVPTRILPIDRTHGQVSAELGTPGDYTDTVDEWIEARVR